MPYQGLCSWVLCPLPIIDIETDPLWFDEPCDKFDAESAMLPDPVGREDDGTAEGTVAGLNRPLTIHSGRGQT